MLFPTSGRIGFDPLPYHGPIIPKSILKAMLTRENEIRLTEKVQNQYDSCALNDSDMYTFVTETVQKQVLQEFHFPDDSQSLNMLRSALTMYPNDSELKELVYYHKYNRSRQGDLSVGDDIDMSLIPISNLQGNSIQSLESFERKGSPLILIAGSIS